MAVRRQFLSSTLFVAFLSVAVALPACSGDGGGGGDDDPGGENGGESNGGSGADDGGAQNNGATSGNGDDAGANGQDEDAGTVDLAKCGNRKPDPFEECDDGNRTSGDGCSAMCQQEEGFNCASPGAACEECGNKIDESTETCDDGNRVAGDGCDDTCQIETGGWVCPIAGEPCERCGDSIVDAQELCDDGNLMSGDGCAEDCRSIETNYSCPASGGKCELCGNGTVGGDEVCDDGNTTVEGGCTFNCKAEEPGWVCPKTGGACTICGDKVVNGALEQCDDGNINEDDGCDNRCQKEAGATCLLVGQLCFVCGNGFIEPVSVKDDKGTPTTADDTYNLEGCDDGNLTNGDGCSATCQRDPAYACPVPGFACNLCGDGLVTGLERCDDGKQCTDGKSCTSAAECAGIGDGTCSTRGILGKQCTDGKACASAADCTGIGDGTCILRAGDGCAADCSFIEPNYHCEMEGELCARCGDGFLDFGEQCDDGVSPTLLQPVGGDGCGRTCQVEDGWFCSTNTDLTFDECSLCGNGKLELNEVCDDANTTANDGCAADCLAVDPGYNCFPNLAGFPCALCGDGVVDPGEQCDEGPGNKTAGCNAMCQIVTEPLPWVCLEQGKPCELCGDDILGANFESCEDGNIANGDGCSSTCEVEPGYECSGANCQAAACGDGFRAGQEECDDGDQLSGDGCSVTCDIERGFVCPATGGNCRATVCGDTVVEGDEQCDDGNAATPGCDEDCQLEPDYKCPDPGEACSLTECGDGFVEGTEECDDANATTPGCAADCTFEDDYACDTLSPVCNGGDNDGDACASELGCPDGDCSPRGGACHLTECGDGIVEGSEQCDDGGLKGVCRGGQLDGDECTTSTDCTGNGICVDGCDDIECTIEPLYNCEGEPSVCSPILQFVAIRRFNVSNVSPNGLTYDPKTRSFIGYKAQDSQMPIELCLDGTLIENGIKMVCVGGADAGEPCSDGTTCESTVCGQAITGYKQGRVPTATYRDGAYDPFTGHTLYLSSTGELTDIPLCDRYNDPACATTGIPAEITPPGAGALADYTEQLDGGANLQGLTVGEDGNLYVTYEPPGQTEPWIYVFKRRRVNGQIYVPDCVNAPEANCTSFELTRVTVASAAAPASFGTGGVDGDPLAGIFTVPGEEMIGTFNDPANLGTYTGLDAVTGAAIPSSEYFTFYGPIADGLAPRYEQSSLPGLLFDLGDTGFSYVNYAKSAETAAEGGAFVVCPQNPSEDCQLFARTCETDADCTAVIPGTRCVTDSAVGVPYCASPGDARDDRATVNAGSSGNVVDVLANDSLSESACLGPNKRVISVTTPTRGGTVTVTNGGANVTYNAPTDSTSCGFIDTFTYTADLGGGVRDTATVRVVVACKCGDGIKQSNEQCDQGDALNGPYPKRCSTSCTLNVVCGDSFIDPGEECDDENLDSGDGCSALCTLESVCGDGIEEGVEDCDDGNTVSGDTCNANCTKPDCGDGNIDVQVGEQCDDGRTNNGTLNATCSAGCTIIADCGNGVVEIGEQCDKAELNGEPDSGCGEFCQAVGDCGNGAVEEGAEECDGTLVANCGGVGCIVERCICENRCGDGRVGGLEECDDGNPNANDGCTTACKIERCGDGTTQINEQCDDANTNPSDGCTNDCRIVVVCGDGTQIAPEACDDGNNVSGDGCSSTCKDETVVCGDNKQEFPETCDDGNTMPDDGCSESCRAETGTCGNGALDVGEQCDDGNRTEGDDCSPDCLFEGCGDGIVAPGEYCDDGNRTAGDNCSPKCQLEII